MSLVDLLTTLAIPIQVAQIGSLPWLLALLVALHFGVAVLAARAVWQAYVQVRRAAQVRALLTRGDRQR